jgi:CxxC motif-containing protein
MKIKKTIKMKRNKKLNRNRLNKTRIFKIKKILKQNKMMIVNWKILRLLLKLIPVKKQKQIDKNNIYLI